MKFLINRQPVIGPWGGGANFVKAFCDQINLMGHKVTHQLDNDVDVILVIDPRASKDNPSIFDIQKFRDNHNVTIVHRVNECNIKRSKQIDVDMLLRFTSTISDATVFVSNWMKQYHVNKWFCNKTFVVKNGIDHSVFKRYDSKKLDESKINIVSFHWSDDAMKGEETYKWLDDFVGKNSNLYTFSFIGRTKANLSNSRILPPMNHENLAKELSKYDVCINGSKYDPGPNSTLESIACELPTYVHCDGGGSVEFASKDHSFRDHFELKKLLLAKDFTKNDVKIDDWKTCVKNYVKVIEEVHESKNSS